MLEKTMVEWILYCQEKVEYHKQEVKKLQLELNFLGLMRIGKLPIESGQSKRVQLNVDLLWDGDGIETRLEVAQALLTSWSNILAGLPRICNVCNSLDQNCHH